MTAAPPVLLNVARPWDEADPVDLARAAVRAGLDGVALADSPRLFPDCLLETERIMASTEARLAGPCVLSLGLRHPATVASAVRTLATHHPDRVLAVVGRGESSVRNEGLLAPSLRAYEESLSRLRELLDARPPSARLLGAASGPGRSASRPPGSAASSSMPEPTSESSRRRWVSPEPSVPTPRSGCSCGRW